MQIAFYSFCSENFNPDSFTELTRKLGARLQNAGLHSDYDDSVSIAKKGTATSYSSRDKDRRLLLMSLPEQSSGKSIDNLIVQLIPADPTLGKAFVKDGELRGLFKTYGYILKSTGTL